MPTDQEQHERCRLLENVNLLCALLDVPSPYVGENEQPCTAADGGHRLSFRRERQLAGDFAFLAATTDDPLKVRAVGIEEHRHDSGLTIRVATNSGSLLVVKEGFEYICNILKDLSALRLQTFPKLHQCQGGLEEQRRSAQRKIYHRVLKMDCQRILSRLRSHHVKKKPDKSNTRPWIKLLDEQLKHPPITLPEALVRTYQDVRLQLNDLVSAFRQLEDMPPFESFMNRRLEQLALIPEKCCGINADDMRKVLACVPRINPKEVEKWPQLCGKIGRYYGVCEKLSRLAISWESKHFQNIDIGVIVSPNCVERAVPMSWQSFYTTVDNRLQSTGRCLGKALLPYGRLETAKSCFSRRSSSADSGYLHAEMQLLMFYETAADLPCPRIIVSSKKACYLCHLFIFLHRHFIPPETHGRVYNMWCPPFSPSYHAIPRMMSTLHRANEILEAKILDILFSRKPARHCPSESNLPLSDSSVLSNSTIRPAPHLTPSDTNTVRAPSMQQHSEFFSTSTLTRRSSTSSRPPSSHLTFADVAAPKSNPSLQPPSDRTSLQGRSTSTTTSNAHLELQSGQDRSDWQEHLFRDGVSTLRLSKRHFHASIGGIPSSQHATGPGHPQLLYRWLKISSQESIPGFVNIKALPQGSEHITTQGGLGSTEPLALRCDNDVLLLHLRYAKPLQ